MRPIPLSVPVTGTQVMQNTARILYEDFQPYPNYPGVDAFAKKGNFGLSVIICAIMMMAAINLVFIKSEYPILAGAFSNILWVSSAVWGGLFFAFLIFRLIYGRKKFNLFRLRYPYDAKYL